MAALLLRVEWLYVYGFIFTLMAIVLKTSNVGPNGRSGYSLETISTQLRSAWIVFNARAFL